MSKLADFQLSFANNLLQTLADIPDRDTAAMNVYRNTVMKGCIDALAANYPTVFKLVGEDWFNAATNEFIIRSLPGTPILAEYGERFAAFLAEFLPAQELPYLSDVARIDWLWMESCFAADAPVLQASVLQATQGDELLSTRLQLHPATRVCTCKHSAISIWLRNHVPAAVSAELHTDDADEEALITRTPNGVQLVPLCLIEYHFVKEIEKGATLGEAAMIALSYNPQFPLAATLAKLINAGSFAAT